MTVIAFHNVSRTVDLDMVLIAVILTLTLGEARFVKNSVQGYFFYLIPKFDHVGIFNSSLVFLSFFG